MSNYAFMKTGLVGEATTADAIKKSPLMKRLMSLVIVMVEKAAQTAIEYAEHDDRRRQVERDDVVRALKYQARTFFASEDLETRVEDVEARDGDDRFFSFEMRRRNSPDLDPAIGDLDIGDFDLDADLGSDFDIEDLDLGDLDDPPSLMMCHCPSCEDVRRVEAEWDDWDPTDAAEMFLKRHVDALPSQVPVP